MVKRITNDSIVHYSYTMLLETPRKEIYTTELITKPYPNLPHHRENGNLMGMRYNLRFCFSYHLPGDAEAVGPEVTL